MTSTPQPLRSRHLAALLVVATLCGACGIVDTVPPAAPRFDLRASTPVVVRSSPIDLTGTAEFGATLRLTREPAFGADEAPADEIADPYSAAFHFSGVALAPGTNTFTLTATDEAGNTSEASTLEIVYDDAPEAVELSLSTSIVTAGQEGGTGTIVATVRVLGAGGYRVADREVTFALTGFPNPQQTTTTDARGLASAMFTGLRSAGEGRITASVGGVSDSRPFVVVGGAPSRLELRLARLGHTSGASSLGLSAGEAAQALITVRDGSDNLLDTSIALYTDAPGAFIEGRRITNLRVAGNYRVVAAVQGTSAGGDAVSDVALLNVRPGTPATMVLNAPPFARAGERFAFDATALDVFGNAVALESGQAIMFLTSDALGDVTRTGTNPATGTARLVAAGAQTLTARLNHESGTLAREQSIEVLPAPAASLTLGLEAADARPATPQLEVRAALDAQVTVVAQARDPFGNQVESAIALSSDSGVPFDGATLRGLTRAGPVEVRAALLDGSATARVTFEVLPAATQTLHVRLDATRARAGESIGCRAFSTDAFGNRTNEALSVAVDGLPSQEASFDAETEALTILRASAEPLLVRAQAVAPGGPDDATAAIRVDPAAPAQVAVSVAPSNTVRAGENPTLEAVITDAFDNVVAMPAELFVIPVEGTVVEPPGPIVSGGRVFNLVRPGNYLAVAQVPATGVVSNPDAAEARLTVVADDAAIIDLQLARSVAEAGTPVDFSVAVRDVWGNDVSQGHPALVRVESAGEVLVPVVSGTSWTPTAPGAYTLFARLAPGDTAMEDAETLTVLSAPDREPPQLTFHRPNGERTIAAWPPLDALVPAACAGGGETVAVRASDTSLVDRVWLRFGGLISAQPTPPVLDVPDSPIELVRPLCSSDIGPGRGEILVDLAAVDTRGNFARGSASWCVDPDAAGYVPTSTLQRCALMRDASVLAGTRAMGANGRGDLVLAGEAPSGEAILRIFARHDDYGLGPAHVLAGSAPRGVAVVGSTVFTSVETDTGSAIIRTMGLADGTPVDELFAQQPTKATRFLGLSMGSDGALRALLASETAEGGQLLRYDAPLAPLSAPRSPDASVGLDGFRAIGLCSGPRLGEVFVTGSSPEGFQPNVSLHRALGGAVDLVWAEGANGREAMTCAATTKGVAVALSSSQGGSVMRVHAGSGSAVTLMTGWTSEEPLPGVFGLATHGGRLFAAARDEDGGALVRFADAAGL